MTLTHRVKVGLAATAVVAAGVLGGAGLAEAAPLHSHAASVAGPDGARITALPGTREGVAHQAGATNQRMAAGSSSPGFVVTVDAARVRAWVPNGTIIKIVPRNAGGTIGCKIPQGNYTWGWVDSYWNGQHYAGWMRSDLFRVIRSMESPSTYVPWCP